VEANLLALFQSSQQCLDHNVQLVGGLGGRQVDVVGEMKRQVSLFHLTDQTSTRPAETVQIQGVGKDRQQPGKSLFNNWLDGILKKSSAAVTHHF
jgi:hypothetical protein